MRVALLILYGVATWYGPGFYYERLGCGGSFEPGTPPWVALPCSRLHDGWECGDEVWLYFDDRVLKMQVRDCGPFEDYYIKGSGPIVADVPEPYWPYHPLLSAKVLVANVDQAKRELERLAGR